jgi:hypothetical protein
MPRTAVSNGVKPQYRALDIIKLNVPFAPSEVNDYVGTGDYCAKYITFLRRDGFVFESVKDGRKIVSYTLVKEPDNVADFRNLQPKAKATKAPKEKKVAAKKVTPAEKKASAVKKVAALRKGGNAKNLEKLKAIGKTFVPKIDSDEPAEVFGDSGVVGSVDSGWDSLEGVNLKDLI